MSSLPGYEQGRPRALPIAMTLFGLTAVFTGLLNPGGSNGQRRSGLTPDQAQAISADAVAGFPAPPHPDSAPRGPG